MEPAAARQYVDYAAALFRGGSVPVTDRRYQYSYNNDDRLPVFRVNELAHADPKGAVQIIRVNYPIAKYDLCGSPGTQSLQQIIQSCNSDSTIKSMVIWYDSPGGQVDGTEALANIIKSSSKPIISYSDCMMCSAAYWLGCSGSEIIVHGSNDGLNAIVGSIGTMSYWEDMSGKYEKDGIKVHTVFASKSKDKWAEQYKRNSGDEDAYDNLISELDGLNNTFLSAVRKNREGKLRLDKEDVLTGKTYNAKDALQYGLIDKIGDFEFAVRRSLQLAKQQLLISPEEYKSINMVFPKTMKAACADQNFEVLNEGIWLTVDQLSNIEHSIDAHDVLAVSLQQSVSEKAEEVVKLQNDNALLVSEVATLKQRITALENMPAPSTSTTKEEDQFDTNNAQQYAHNQWVDKLLTGE
jgi:protease-4